MVGPKEMTVEGERTTLEGNPGQLMDHRRFLAGIQPGQSPVAPVLLRAAKDVKHVIDEDMAGDLRADLYGADRLTA